MTQQELANEILSLEEQINAIQNSGEGKVIWISIRPLRIRQREAALELAKLITEKVKEYREDFN